jgi:hypothetical protein
VNTISGGTTGWDPCLWENRQFGTTASPHRETEPQYFEKKEEREETAVSSGENFDKKGDLERITKEMSEVRLYDNLSGFFWCLT